MNLQCFVIIIHFLSVKHFESCLNVLCPVSCDKTKLQCIKRKKNPSISPEINVR